MTPFSQLFFAYSTLKDSKIRDKVLGRHVEGAKAILPGYKKLYDSGKYAYLQKVTSLAPVSVAGEVYELTDSDLARLKAWETTYDLIKVRLGDGRMAYTFERKSHEE